MATFTNINESEMLHFLEGQGFVRIEVPRTNEMVWAKIVRKGVSMRIYSGINPNGQSRAKGEDAIRVALFWRDADGDILCIGKSKRVHRVVGWRKNLQNRIDDWQEQLGPSCPKCGSPMTLKQNLSKGTSFYGCITWRKTKCKGSQNA